MEGRRSGSEVSATPSQGMKSTRTRQTRRSSAGSAGTSTAFGEATKVQGIKMLLLSRLGVKTDTTNYLALNMRFFPMRFTDPQMETKYFQLIHKLFPLRMSVLGPLAFGLNLILWCMMGPKLCVMEHYIENASHTWPVFEQSQKLSFHAMQALNCFCYGLVAIGPFLPIVKMNLEVIAYLMLSLGTIGTMVMCIWGLLLAPIEGVDLTVLIDGNIFELMWATEKLPLLITAPQFKMWADCFLNLCAFGLTLAVDVFLPTRTRFSIIFHGVLLGCCCGVLAATSIILGSAYNTQPLLLLQGLVMASVITLGFLGRYFAELCDRASGYEHIQNVERLDELEAEVKSSSKTKSSTGVEDLLRFIKQAQRHFANVKLGKAEEFGKAEDMLKTSLQMISKTQDLYAVRFVPEDDRVTQRFMAMFSRTPPELTEKQKEAEKKKKEQKMRRAIPLPQLEPVPVPERLLAAELFGTAGTDWGLDILKLSKDSKCILVEVGLALLENYASCMWTSSETLMQFLWQVERLYFPSNPYHNAGHGAAVGHMTACLASYVGLFNSEAVESIEVPCVLIAALAHDIGHPGRSNDYFVKTSHPLALLYNDVSPLENLHACLLFRIFAHEPANIFSAIDEITYRMCRSAIVKAILATDMRSHFEQLSLFRVRRGAPDFDFITSRSDFWQTAAILIKTADLGHTAVDWLQHSEWAARITEEFYQQGEDESRLGCDVSPMFDRGRHKDYAKYQKGFVEYVVQPLFKEVEEIDASGQVGVECVRRLVYNRYKWEERGKTGEAIPIAESIRQCKTVASLPLLCGHVESLVSGSKLKVIAQPTAPRVKFAQDDHPSPQRSPARTATTVARRHVQPEPEPEDEEEEEEEEEEDDDNDEYEYYEEEEDEEGDEEEEGDEGDYEEYDALDVDEDEEEDYEV